MFRNYLLMASKVYWRRKMFTAINLLCIVLTLVVLLAVTAILEHSFAPSGVESKSDRFLQVDTVRFYEQGDNVSQSGLGYRLIQQYLKPMKSAQMVATVSRARPVAVYQDQHVEKLAMAYADAAFWQVMDFKLLAGRLFNEADVAQGRFVVVINASTAKKLFNDVAVAGKKINVLNQQFEIIGVVADAYQTYSSDAMWAPLTTIPSGDFRTQLSGDFTAIVMAVNSSGVEAMRKEVWEIGRKLVQEDPAQWQRTAMVANTKLDSFARGFSDDRMGEVSEDSGATQVLMWVAILMFLFMLLPALNLVNLNLGRMMERSAEIGVRKAFGATPWQLTVQFLIENVFLSWLGCLIALSLTQGLLIWLSQTGIIPYLQLGVNWKVFMYGMVTTTVFGLVSGVLPAWRMARLDPVLALKGNA